MILFEIGWLNLWKLSRSRVYENFVLDRKDLFDVADVGKRNQGNLILIFIYTHGVVDVRYSKIYIFFQILGMIFML